MVDTIPPTNTFLTILAGLAIVLVGVIANGKAGLIREKDQKNSGESQEGKGSMLTGILIAVIGGLLATGFSYANAVGRPIIHEACQAAGNPEWVTAVAVMFPIFISGGVVMTFFFAYDITKKKSWGIFKSPHFVRNLGLIAIMAVFHYAASALFAFAASKLGASGNTVGYAIFNTSCVATAIVSGLMTKEWVKASSKARTFLYVGLACMIVGIVIISIWNGLT